MRDIESAMIAEQEYLEHRLYSEEPYSLLSKIQEFGFSDLDEYFKYKIIYNVKQLDFSIEDTTTQCGASKTHQLAINQQAGFIFGKATSTCVFHGTEPFNEEYCTEHDIEVIDYQANGGNIVVSANDLSVGISVPVSDVNTDWILDRVVEKMNRYGANAYADGNDIMVDGRKVAGCASYNTPVGCGFVAHFSFSEKTDLIRSICTPETIGKPIGFISFMTPDQLRKEIIEWQL